VKLDTVQIDQAVLALVSPGLHDGSRAWKSFGRDAMARLHEKGYISCPHRADEEYYLFRPRTDGIGASLEQPVRCATDRSSTLNGGGTSYC